MATRVESTLTTCGREAGQAELEHAQEVIRLCRGLSRYELALTLCEHWGWVSPTGGLQQRACMRLLEKWEAAGLLSLPEKDTSKQRTSLAQKPIPATERTTEQDALCCDLAQLQPVWLEVVSGREATAIWSEYVSRYHPLGCKRTIGCTLRYFVSSERGRLGCILMGSAAVALAVRDKWIGWSRQERLAHLPWVINNQRLLLFPWVRVPHLVSHVLGQLARRVQADWEARWDYRPVLMETFVDPAHHRGVGYRAAGWLLLGQSTGEGIQRRQHAYRTTPKMLFVKPLTPDFRTQLRSPEAMRTRCLPVEQERISAEARPRARPKARRKPSPDPRSKAKEERNAKRRRKQRAAAGEPADDGQPGRKSASVASGTGKSARR